MSERMQCFFCDEEAVYTGFGALNQQLRIECPNCGIYITQDDLLRFGSKKEYEPVKHLISGLIKEKNDLGLEVGRLTFDNTMSLLQDPLIPRTMAEKLSKIVLYFYRNYKYFGCTLEVFPDFYAIGYSKNSLEFQFMISELVSQGYLHGSFMTGDPRFVFKGSLTFRGMIWGEELIATNIHSNKVFVAMGFKEDLLEAHAKAIKPACEECGFKAFLISETEHNEGITDKIIAEIKTSKFMITDFTYNNCGAYFEAGYAQGKGLDVIRTCKKEWFDGMDKDGNKNRVHFDVNHYNFIVWENFDDLKEKLINRIRATIL